MKSYDYKINEILNYPWQLIKFKNCENLTLKKENIKILNLREKKGNG